jgi:hypothetical protein
MRKYNFDLQLFAEDFVPVDTLKGHFSDEELQSISPKEEQPATQDPIVGPIAEPEVNEPEPEQNAPGGETASKHVPYDRFKEVNEKNKILAAELAALKAAQPQPQAVQQQPTPPAQPQQTASVSEQIAKMADEKVRKELGISEDDVELLNLTDPKKYLQYVKEVSKEEFRMEAEYQQKQQVYNENVTFVNELIAIPDFPVLFQFAQQELDELPRKEAKKIDDAYARVDSGRGTKDDFVIIREFANKCKEKMSGINTAPMTGAFSMPPTQQPAPTVTPTANPLDKAANLPRASNLSGAKTSATSWAQVEQLIREGKSDQIPKDMLAQIDKRLV